MVGDREDGRMYVRFLFITVFMRLAFIRQRSRFQQRLRLLTIRSNKGRTETCYFQLRRKFRKKKIAWVLERPQFWLEHMVLSHYENNIWQEHFLISRKTLHRLIVHHLMGRFLDPKKENYSLYDYHVVLNAAEVSRKNKNSTRVVFAI